MGTQTGKRIVKIQCDIPTNAFVRDASLLGEIGEGFPKKVSLELRLRRQRSRKGFPGRGSSICKGVEGAWSHLEEFGQILGEKDEAERLLGPVIRSFIEAGG